MNAQQITALLRSHAYRTATETQLQTDIGQVLTRAGVDFIAEHRLDPRNRIDFMCGTVGIEAKTRHPKRQTFKQLQRYANFDEVTDLILITGTFMGLPEDINGKPVYMVSLGRSAL